MFVTGEAPTIERDARRDGRVRARPAGRPGAPLLEPRLRPARRGRRAAERDAVHGVRRRPDPRAARARRGRRGRSRRRARSATSSTSTRAPPRASRTRDMGGVAAMGQLWSTVGDLCRVGRVPGRGRATACSRRTTVDEMWAPQVMMNPDDWTVGWGLGLELVNHEGRVFGGHGGAMPGFLAGLYVNRETKTGAAVLTNAGTRAPTRDIALELAGRDARALAARHRAVAARDRRRRPRSRRSSAAGGPRATSSCFSWKDGKLDRADRRERRRGSSRRSSSRVPTAATASSRGASGASASASTATG